MRRCTRCVLPDTVPGITFNAEGACSYCQRYQPQQSLGVETLEHLVAAAKKSAHKYDCVVAASGGRDSTYVLYLAKAVYDLNVLAVHYDHEFVVPHAMANLRTACERLKIDLVSIRSQRGVGRKLVRAGLRCSDKYACFALCRACEYGYHSAAYRAAIQHKVPMIWWGASKLEHTDDLRSMIPKPSFARRLSKFLNVNLYRTIQYSLLQQFEFPVPGNPISPRAIPALKDKDIKEVFVFDHIGWERNKIKDTIAKELGWQKPPGSISTWRTDCSLYPLANYCYFKACGCSKACFGYCNMINSGQMRREEALHQEEYMKEHCGDTIEALLRDEVGLSAGEVAKML